MRFGILQFPGSNCDQDCLHVLGPVLGQDAFYLWHKEDDLRQADCVVLPGGFSYGDYLRCGAIARFSPIMREVKKFAERGGLVIGICNGFQILVEAGLLPGALLRNRTLKFRCETVHLRVENNRTPFTNMCQPGQILRVPIAHGEGSYFADPQTLAEIQKNNQVAFRYCNEKGQINDASNPNGSVENIAGIVNARGNVLGMMPHPERASEGILGSEDGRVIFESILHWARQAVLTH
ncbi:MAG: phosphoribosylformylglycinamidine synthase subunit PurQ [Verrucomicrobiae bacterium]|nr:phosphoribosylformylglycinamidine synthase subunit PurQ [Verrucomicrobiae bacterium]